MEKGIKITTEEGKIHEKKIELFFTVLLIGTLLSSLCVGATTISGNEVADIVIEEQVEVVSEAETDLSAMEITRENSAYPMVYEGLQTEARSKKYLFLGDSIACGYNDESGNQIYPFVYYFSQIHSGRITNKAVGGATLSTTFEPNINTQLKDINLSDYDTVILSFGVNDFSKGCTIGDTTNYNTLTVCGSLNSMIQKCKNAGVTCYVILPFPCKKQFEKKTNINGYYYPDFVKSIDKVCKQNGIQTINFYSQFGVNIDNFNYYYVDSVHPGNELQNMAAVYLHKFLSENEVNDSAPNDIIGYIERLYRYCLLREYDESGMSYWYQMLETGKMSGAQVAQSFFFSEEFKNRNVSDQQYLNLLYKAMMNREPDKSGMEYWNSLLANGVSREYVFKGFAESKEFSDICDYYNVDRGTVALSEARDKNAGVTQFISRLYTKALGREYDLNGLNYWCDVVDSGKMTITDVSTTGFFHSKEFTNKNLSDEEYVKVLYRTFLGREYDETGLKYWLDVLQKGKSRDDVLLGFANSKEFAAIKMTYGIR